MSDKEEKNTILHIHLKREGAKLIFTKDTDKKLHEKFMNSLKEGQFIDIFFDSNVDDGTLAQIAKIKASIRCLAAETGTTFDDTELIVKKRSGLIIKKEIEGQTYMTIKSFGKCSKSELSLAIQTIIQMEDFVGIKHFEL